MVTRPVFRRSRLSGNQRPAASFLQAMPNNPLGNLCAGSLRALRWLTQP